MKKGAGRSNQVWGRRPRERQPREKAAKKKAEYKARCKEADEKENRRHFPEGWADVDCGIEYPQFWSDQQEKTLMSWHRLSVNHSFTKLLHATPVYFLNNTSFNFCLFLSHRQSIGGLQSQSPSSSISISFWNVWILDDLMKALIACSHPMRAERRIFRLPMQILIFYGSLRQKFVSMLQPGG